MNLFSVSFDTCYCISFTIIIVVFNSPHQAIKVYEIEETKCPQKQFRLGGQVDPSNFMKLRGGNKPARSLPELTGDRNIFQMLHVAFLWILKMCGSRITETLLEGPPTEDSIIDMENQEGSIYNYIRINPIIKIMCLL